MAEYRDHYTELQGTGVGLVALSADEPKRSEALRRSLKLPFPILCDTTREVIKAWGVFNPWEMGGIARHAVFLLDRDRRVRFRSVDSTAAAVRAPDLVQFLRRGSEPGPAKEPRRRFILPRVGDLARSLVNSLRYGMRSPKKSP